MLGMDGDPDQAPAILLSRGTFGLYAGYRGVEKQDLEGTGPQAVPPMCWAVQKLILSHIWTGIQRFSS